MKLREEGGGGREEEETWQLRPSDSKPTCMINLVVSVFPAPDSPDTRIDCDLFSALMNRYASSATANT